MSVIWGHSQNGLNHIPLLQDACAGLRGIFFGLHETPRRHGELGLDSGRVARSGHAQWKGVKVQMCFRRQKRGRPFY